MSILLALWLTMTEYGYRARLSHLCCCQGAPRSLIAMQCGPQLLALLAACGIPYGPLMYPAVIVAPCLHLLYRSCELCRVDCSWTWRHALHWEVGVRVRIVRKLMLLIQRTLRGNRNPNPNPGHQSSPCYSHGQFTVLTWSAYGVCLWCPPVLPHLLSTGSVHLTYYLHL